MADIRQHVDLTHPFEVEIVPNDCDDTVLYFGLVDFVKQSRQPAPQPMNEAATKKWKCIVWDLDNTLWEGTLIEDGPSKLHVKKEVVRVIEETDRRGILHSIASKNNREDALGVLKANGLSEYFLQPQIGWNPKSESIARIAKLLNIGIDTLAFIDDQEFEREEVKAALPQVALIDAKDCAALPDRAECQVPVTEESRQRRLMYRQQEQRDATLDNFKGDYSAFLKDCHIQLQIGPLNEENIERVYELAQRTNQMNFSGNRYPQDKLQEIMRSDAYETYVMKCTDKFGSYGIVGFAVVDIHEPRLLDLMFSCRIQSKRVEHAFFSFLLNRLVRLKPGAIYANYKRTEKNAPAGKVFEEVGFERAGEEAGITSFIFDAGRSIPDDKIIEVLVEANS
ncbi:MAG: HAD-IIIC family phosphatase [Candidatus Aminicenantes bacterium]|nr:HAD-IIIC family phosphatase [Candidatus Aminicenantes bacterium]